MSQKNGNPPTHRLYIVKGEGENARWLEAGAAWANRDGQGFTLSIDVLPLNGRLVMRAADTKPGREGGQP